MAVEGLGSILATRLSSLFGMQPCFPCVSPGPSNMSELKEYGRGGWGREVAEKTFPR